MKEKGCFRENLHSAENTVGPLYNYRENSDQFHRTNKIINEVTLRTRKRVFLREKKPNHKILNSSSISRIVSAKLMCKKQHSAKKSQNPPLLLQV